MIVRRTPLALAISLAAATSTVQAAPTEEESAFGHVPYFQYIYFTEEEFAEFEGEHHESLGEYTNGKYLTVDKNQEGLDDPLFLVVGTQLDDAYDRQNPSEIVAENRDAVSIVEGTWNKAIIVNTSEISATGEVDYPGYGLEPAAAIIIDAAHLTGLAATDSDTARLDGMPVFEHGDERVFLYNTGSIRADEVSVLIISDEIDENDNIISAPAVVRGSLINHAPGAGEGIIESTGANDAEHSYAFAMVNAHLYGNIVNGLATDTGKAVFRGRDGAIFIFDGSVLNGDIVNRDLLEGADAIRIEDSEFNGRIVNHTSGEIRAYNGTAIDIRNTAGDIFIDQRGTLHADGYLDALGFEPSRAMHLQGNNIHARLSSGSVVGDTLMQGATVTYAGGTYTGNVTNQGGLFVVEGLQRIDGSYEQNAAATLSLSSQQISRLTADSIQLASGSTLVIGNGDAYRDFVDGGQVVVLEASNLADEIDLDTLNLLSGSGLLRVHGHRFSEDGTQLLVSYSGLNGEQLANEARQRSGATGAKARQLQALGHALNNVLMLNDQAAQVIGNNIDRLEELLPDTSGAVSASTSSATQAGANAVSTRARGVAAGDMLEGQGIWVKGLYGEVSQRQRDGIEGFDSDTQGFVLGGDRELVNGTVLGLAWARTNTDVTGKNGLTSSEVDFDQLSAYTSRAYGSWLFDAQLSYGIGSNETSRRVMGSTAHANFDSRQIGAQATAGYEWQLDNATRLTPRVSLDYANLKLDAYEERGAGALNLRNEEQRIERFELGLAGTLAHLTQVGELMVEPRLTLGAHHDFQGKARSSISSFAFAPDETRFVVDGPEADKTRYQAGLGLDIYSVGGFTTSLDYGFGWSSSMSAHAGALQLRYDF